MLTFTPSLKFGKMMHSWLQANYFAISTEKAVAASGWHALRLNLISILFVAPL